MSDFLATVAPIMVRQQALITIAQVLDSGGNHQLASDYVRRGVWERVDRALYGPAGVPMTWHRRLMAAVLLAPVGSLVSHRAGAALQRVGGLVEPTPELSIPQGTRFRRDDVIVHESKDLHLAAPQRIQGIPVTGPARLAMDLGSVVSEKRFRQTIRELRFHHGVGADMLLRTYLRHKRQGRNGGGALRDWLDRYYHVNGVPESGLELLVLDAFIDAGLPVPQLQWTVDTPTGTYRLDFAYPELMLAIEVDGRQHEDDPEVVCSDRTRTTSLRRHGWTIVRIRSQHFSSDLHQAILAIRRHLSGI